jgi:hypothetical protein
MNKAWAQKRERIKQWKAAGCPKQLHFPVKSPEPTRREHILARIAHWERAEEQARIERNEIARETARVMQDYLHEIMEQSDD